MDNIGQSAGTSARTVAAERGVAWFTEAWEVFKAQPGLWVLLTVISLGILLVCGVVPLLGNLLTPFVSTLLAAGLMLVARKQRGGATPEVGDLFAILSHPALARLLIMTLIYAGLAFAALLLVGIVFGLGGGVMALLGGLAAGDTGALAAGAGSLVLGALVYLAILVPILALYWFAVPLLLFREMEPWPAMRASLNGVLANMVSLLVYGVVGLVLLVIASIPLMLGLLVAMPLMLISWLASYDDIFPAAG